MSEQVEAIYENGVFRPVKPVNLPEGERVSLTVASVDDETKDPAYNLADIAEETGIPDLSTNIDHYLYGLPKQSDAELWQIARRQLPPDKLLRCQQLIGKHEEGEVLMSEELRELDILIEEGDRLAIIKSEAYILLKQRGQRLPDLERLKEH